MELWGISDPDSSLTDFAIALLCLVLVVQLARGPGVGRTRRWLVLFFSGAGLAAALGGTVHAFFDFPGTPEYEVLWPATMIAIGLASLGAWGIGSRLILKDGAGSALIGLATVEFLAYSGIVAAGFHEFRLAIFQYLPATVFLTVSVVIANRRSAHPGFRQALLGLGLTFVAAGIQAGGIALHPVYFDHNAVYHVVQAGALIFFYRGMTRALRPAR